MDVNPVLDFFQQEENKNKKLSTNTLSKKLNISRKHIWHYKHISDHLIKVQPQEVGSNACSVRVIKYVEDPSQYNEKKFLDINRKNNSNIFFDKKNNKIFCNKKNIFNQKSFDSHNLIKTFLSY